MGWANEGSGTTKGGSGSQPRVRFSAIGEAWGLFRQHMGVWILAVLIQLACYAGVAALATATIGPPLATQFKRARPILETTVKPGPNLAHSLVVTIVNGFFIGGMFRMACNQLRGRQIHILDLFAVSDVLGRLILACFLYGLLTFVGFMICFIPGLIASGLMMFTIPLVVDGRLSATEAITRSARALKDQWVLATLFHLVAVFIAGLGSLLCGVGFLLTVPLYPLSIAILYRDFFHAKFGDLPE